MVNQANNVCPEGAIAALEKSLLEPAIRASAAELDRLLADGFVEFASTGRSFGKQEALARLPSERGRTFRARDLHVRMLGPEAALVTYSGEPADASGTKRSLRSSVWIREDGEWRMVFHQGTPLTGGTD